MKTDSVTISRVASRSAITLFIRQTTIQVISLFASVLLARLLTPADYGMYALVGFFMQFLTLLSDGGIAASIVQRTEVPDKNTLSTAFTVVQGFYLIASLIALPGAMLFTHIYHGMSIQISMIYVSVLAFYLTSFRVIPAVRLERELKYTKLATVETIEYSAYQITAVILALNDGGVWSFILAGLVSRIVGLILLNILSPFFPQLRLDWGTAKSMLRFGMSLQVVDVVQFIQSALTPTFVAMRLGTIAVGYVNFANKVSSYPTYPLNVINRMMFPLLSRIHHDEHAFDRTLHRIIRIYAVILFGMICVLGATLPDTIRIVFSPKWNETMVLIYSSLIGSITIAVTSPVGAAVMARGLATVFLRYTIINVCLIWAIGIPSVYALGLNGLSVLNLTPIISLPLLLFVLRKHLRVRFWRTTWKPLLAMLVVVVTIRLLSNHMNIHSLPLLVFIYALTAACYVFLYLAIDASMRRAFFKGIPVVLSRLKISAS